METENIVDEQEVGGEEGRALRVLLGGRILRKKRIRRALLAHLLRQEDEVEDNEVDDEEGGDEQQLLRLIVGGRAMKRRKLKQLTIAQLLRNRDDDEDEGI